MPWEMRTVEKQREAFVEAVSSGKKRIAAVCREFGMALSYNRMWKLLVDKKMSKADLRKAADIAPNTMTKLRRDEAVNLAILARICETLDCDFGDIMEYVKEPK